MEDFQSKYSGEQVEEMLDQIANGEMGGGASVYTWEWDGNEQGSVADEVFTSIYNSDVLYLRYAGTDIPAIIARAEQTIIILASIQAGDSLLNIKITFTGWNYTVEMISTEIGGGGGNVYKWVWNTEMDGTFTEEEFENLNNADAIYISVNVAGMEVLYSVDGKYVSGDALYLGIHALSFETDTDNSEVAYVENMTFIFDNTSKTWSVQGGNAELITNEQLTAALEGKQDTIEDLEEIRQGAAKGNTALQKDTIFNWEMPTDDDGSLILGGELTEEEYNRLKNSDIVLIKGIPAGRGVDELFCFFGPETLVVYIGNDGGAYYYSAVSSTTEVPTKTSQLENDSNFVSSNNLKTINGQSIVGSGDIEIGGEGGGTSSDGRKKVIYVGTESSITSMRPNVIYWIVGFEDVSIESFEEPVYGVDTYDVFTAIIELGQTSESTVSLTLPDYVEWANGVIPEIIPECYELSISRISDGDYTHYFAVLTPFKYV
jgi:hypothetical protein